MRYALAIVLTLLAVSPIVAQEKEAAKILDYTTAYKLSQTGEKPMLVLVTATWCGPCQQMKATTLPQLFAKDTFKKLNFAMVDYDAEPDVANALVGDRGVPQLILFRKVDDQWVRSYVAGMQTPDQVEAFIAKSSQVQIADADTAASGKSSRTIDK